MSRPARHSGRASAGHGLSLVANHLISCLMKVPWRFLILVTLGVWWPGILMAALFLIGLLSDPLFRPDPVLRDGPVHRA